MNIPPAPRASPVERDAASEDMRELSPIAPPTVHEIASAVSMVAGAGVPNNDVTPPRVRPVEANIALKNMRGRWLLDPDPAPQRMWIGKLSFVFSLAAIVLVAAFWCSSMRSARMRVASPPRYRLWWWTIVQGHPFSRHAWWSKVDVDSPMSLYRSAFRSWTRRGKSL